MEVPGTAMSLQHIRVLPVKESGRYPLGEGDTVGTGSLKITAFEQNKSITQLLSFEKPMKSEAIVNFKFENTSSGVKVTWIIEGDLGYPIGRFMKGSIEKSMIGDFDKGLSNLKKKCESSVSEIKIEEKNDSRYEVICY